MLKTSFIGWTFTLSLLSSVRGQEPAWAQCGGTGFSGAATCVSGYTCTYLNDWFSQCIPGTAASSSATTSAVSSTSAASSSTSAASPPASTGFVKTSGQKFVLDGKEFTAAGENSYWVGLFGYGLADMNKAFADIAATGSTVVRTLGFNDVTAPTAWPYYQLWNGSTPTVNTGPLGLENFDNVVAAAKANNIRLLITLTNNWSDYGGMDVYVTQILNSTFHDLFYTDPQVKAAYKNYVKTFVSRYTNEPTIMAWELANEPRCYGSTGTTSGNCTTTTITNWISEISAYIKSIDSNHLVAVGDEGFFKDPELSPSYPYQGYDGIDFNANLNISTIDFGTFHSYPQSYAGTYDPISWGNQWITDHANAQKAANKPVLMEEFGALSNQTTYYAAWYQTVVSSGLAGDLIWQAGSHLSAGDTPNDGYAEYPDGDVYPLITQHTAALKARG